MRGQSIGLALGEVANKIKVMSLVASQKPNEYYLANFKSEADNSIMHQKVAFYEMGEGDSFENGTTLEEMLRVSIERLTDLNGRFGCRENSIAITKMQEALMWLNQRTAERKARGVEGQHKA